MQQESIKNHRSFQINLSGLYGLALVILMIVTVTIVSAEGYDDPNMILMYAGMIKPQIGLNDYAGETGYHYSTAYNGRYPVVEYDPQGNPIYIYYGEGTGDHPGVDIMLGNCIMGDETPIRAVAQGEIITIGEWEGVRDPCDPAPEGETGFGHYVIIRHDNILSYDGYGGTAYSIYAHLHHIIEDRIVVGNKVLRGTIIGYQGSTGGSSGPHLHFQIDRDTIHQFPFWPDYCCDNIGYQDDVEAHTFNPMYFVQAHIVNTGFQGDGAQYEYYPNIDFLYPEDQGREAEIDHEWFYEGPLIYDNDFSADWAGAVYITNPGYWYFYVTADDGAQLWIDDVQLAGCNDLGQQYPSVPHTLVCGTTLSFGTHNVTLKFVEYVQNATIQLAWKRAIHVNLPIARMHSPDGNTPTPIPTHTWVPTYTPKPTFTPTPDTPGTSTPIPTETPTPSITPTPTRTNTPIVNLSISKSHNGSFRVNHAGVYQLSVTNLDWHPTTGIVVVDTLPNEVQFVSVLGTNWGCEADGQTVTCQHPGPINPGESLPDIQLVVKPRPAAVPNVSNLAEVSSQYPDPDPSNNNVEDLTNVKALPSADFDGDGDSDIAVFRPVEGNWYHDGGGAVLHGQPGDIPVPADYDGDGKTERAYFRPDTGEWSICDEVTINSGVCVPTSYTFGQEDDIPVPADYDGDGEAEMAYFRPDTGEWSICTVADINSGVCTSTSYTFGQQGDIPVPADYDGDGQAEMAYFRPATGAWSICTVVPDIMSECSPTSYIFGQQGDIPAPADYDGDGEAEMAYFRPSTGTWSICTVVPDIMSECSPTNYTFGQEKDIPAPGDYNGDGKVDMAIFRPGTPGLWRICYVNDINSGACQPSDLSFGGEGDIPAEKRPAYTGYPY